MNCLNVNLRMTPLRVSVDTCIVLQLTDLPVSIEAGQLLVVNRTELLIRSLLKSIQICESVIVIY